MKYYPKLVRLLTQTCDGWIVGSAATSEDPRDYDIYIPMEMWHIACSIVPEGTVINRMGGFKAISEGKEVDIWTGSINHFLATSYFKAAYHPKSGTKIIKE